MIDKEKIRQYTEYLHEASVASDEERKSFIKGYQAGSLWTEICREMTAEEIYTYCVTNGMGDEKNVRKLGADLQARKEKESSRAGLIWFKPWTWL